MVRESFTLDPLLSNCSVIMINEAHERGMQTHMFLGALKRHQAKGNMM